MSPTGVTPALAIVIPVLDEAENLPGLLAALAEYRAAGDEILVVDGGSRDAGPALARAAGGTLIESPRGRAAQMNAGAAVALAPRLLFLHADTRLPEGGRAALLAALATGDWGRFDVRIEGRHPLLRWVAWLMNRRSRLTGIATGDQAIFVTRQAFDAVGGYPDQPLMEDIELSRRLKRRGRSRCLRLTVTTSGRRWERRGVCRTILLMWRLRLAYWLGASPEALARRYH
ncbi:TIGR04283 family arsenosugar biosynthesis glycosyltransferase [Halomonas salifodinae]|uniref:TIGR04283 family arsenosugar biosynthesis glycosyltransferase n=1 Tax=Halomonas salifodinae TaxID=438745 RepID=A0ABW2EZJ1_9GAMM